MTTTNKIPDDIKKMLHSAPVFTSKQAGVKPGPVVARGFAQFKEHINKNGRPKSDDPRVVISVRLPKSYADKIRNSGRGWQTRLGNYITDGITAGAL